MLIRELSPSYVASCHPDTTLTEAASLMREHDCGILPVVDGSYKVLGVLTDRDICMAVTRRDVLASALRAQDVMSTTLHAIGAGDTAAQALRIMRKHHVRRLPITAPDGVLEGIVSLNDLFLAAKPLGGSQLGSPSHEDLIQTMKAICTHPSVPHMKSEGGLARI